MIIALYLTTTVLYNHLVNFNLVIKMLFIYLLFIKGNTDILISKHKLCS